MSLIAADHICVRLDGKEVLHDVSLKIAPGEIVTLIGPNGAGKSTLAKVVLGVVRPTAPRNAASSKPRPSHCAFWAALISGTPS